MFRLQRYRNSQGMAIPKNVYFLSLAQEVEGFFNLLCRGGLVDAYVANVCKKGESYMGLFLFRVVLAGSDTVELLEEC